MRIVLFRESIESFNYFTDMLAGCFTRKGHTVFLMELLRPDAFSELSAFLSEGAPDLVIAFDRIGLHSPEFISVWDKLGCLCINIFMDPPFRFHSLLSSPPKHLLMFCPDRKHVEYIRTWFPDAGDVCFLPHPATDPGPEALTPFEDREFDVLFPGSFYSPEERLQNLTASVGEEFAPIYREIFDYMLEAPEADITDASLTVLKDRHLPEEPKFLKRFFSTLEPLVRACRLLSMDRS